MKDLKVVNVQDERVKDVQFGCLTVRRLITKSREGSEKLMLGVIIHHLGCDQKWTYDEDEVMFLVKGKITIYWDDKKTDVKEGDAIYLPAGRSYRAVATEKSAFGVYVTPNPIE